MIPNSFWIRNRRYFWQIYLNMRRPLELQNMQIDEILTFWNFYRTKKRFSNYFELILVSISIFETYNHYFHSKFDKFFRIRILFFLYLENTLENAEILLCRPLTAGEIVGKLWIIPIFWLTFRFPVFLWFHTDFRDKLLLKA